MLSRDQFFHGTVRPFQEGDVVAPAGDRRNHRSGSGEHAYATGSADQAWDYAELAHAWEVHRMDRGPFPVPRVFRVEPVGEHEADPNGEHESDVRSRHGFRVTGEEPFPEHLGDPEDWKS